MLFCTITHWDRTKPWNQGLAIDEKVLKMISQGKTDGTMTEMPSPEPNVRIRSRNWISLESAQEWMDYLNSLNNPPLKIDLVRE